MCHDGVKRGHDRDGWEREKHRNTLGFLKFFALLGGSEEVSDILEAVLDEFGTFSDMLATKSAKMSQH